ncbi:MAG: co-chaperone GroES [Phycisphaerales bacterium]|nr:MAG: co-chaperone GroES [Phycisphaerales bacterium]
MRIRPVADGIVVQRFDAEDRTSGGIVLPDTAKEKPQQGRVIEVGDGKLLEDGTRKEMDVRKGDRILFKSYAGTEVKVAGKEYLILKEDDVLGIIEA